MGVRRRLAPQKHVGGDEHDCRKSHVEVTDNMRVLEVFPHPVLCS